MSYWRSAKFKALQRAWYEKLEADGFDDAEELNGDEMTLKHRAAYPYYDTDELIRQTKEAYFTFMTQKAQATTFPNEVDRLIMTRHAEGRMICAIIRELTEMGEPRARTTIRFRIRVYEMNWGLRQYTAKQLNKKVS